MAEQSPFAFLRLRLPLWVVSALLVIVLAGGLGVGLLVGFLANRSPVACPESPEVCEEFAVFWEAWELSRSRFVDPEAANPEVMIAGAITGMVDSLGDQGHTRFLTASEAEAWDTSLSGSFEGIGAYIDVRDGQTMIVAPIEGSPAEQAGILPGDAILAVDDDPTTGWSIDLLRTRVRGPKGTTVTLLLQRAGVPEPFEVAVVRDQVVVPSVSWHLLPEEIALVRLSSFDSNSGRQMREALLAAREQGARAVILDLRNNPGGLLDQAVEVASQFLPAGTVVLQEEDRQGRRTSRTTQSGGVALDLPLFVLINNNSASSSEIVSGAFQSAERGMLIGETTFGTGTVLTPYRLSDGSRLLLGTQQWLTPDGALIRGQGITPDEEVRLPFDVIPLRPTDLENLNRDEIMNSDDLQLVRALTLATETVGTP